MTRRDVILLNGAIAVVFVSAIAAFIAATVITWLTLSSMVHILQ